MHYPNSLDNYRPVTGPTSAMTSMCMLLTMLCRTSVATRDIYMPCGELTRPWLSQTYLLCNNVRCSAWFASWQQLALRSV